uniref:Uncharacterized protein n=1 Tax=Solibacter usitatus (strain Ellin6076) TaxID=234267 RepID=Q026W4_SOLUE
MVVDNGILQYRSALSYNREVFLLEHSDKVKAFSAIDDVFFRLIEFPRSMRDLNGNSLVALVPFILLLQRQSRAAFEALSVFQSYQAWVLLRPGIEAALIIGKWVDDPASAKVWKDRDQDRRAYGSQYTGRALRPTSLPASDKIQGVLSKVNGDFVHANPDYYSRHLDASVGDPGYVNMILGYFDDDGLHEAHVLAFLRLLLVIEESLAGLSAKLFGPAAVVGVPMAVFEAQFGARIRELTAIPGEGAAALRDLGLVD